MNESVTKVFVEQPLALPESANYFTDMTFYYNIFALVFLCFFYLKTKLSFAET